MKSHQSLIRMQQQQQFLLPKQSSYHYGYSNSYFHNSHSSFASLMDVNESKRKSTSNTTTTTTTSSLTLPNLNENDILSSNNNHNNNIPIEWQGEVLTKLRTIIDPDLHTDIVTLGFIQNLQIITSNTTTTTTKVSFNVVLTTPACPIRDEFQIQCEQNVLQLAWVDQVIVNMTSSSSTTITQRNTDPLLSGMANVNHIIAVSSCKGGVGKSTTAVNLAFALQQLSPNVNIAIFDVDVYGPSLPTMVQPDHDTIQFIGRQIAPLQRNNIKLMSFGYVSDDPAIMRGPIITQLLDQIISITQWGNIDYMILDMPPGTGDIPLTLTQRLNITAAVIVTTPQELSYTDVVRGIQMFDSVNVPCIAVVENMAYYEIDKSSSSLSDTTTASETKALVQNMIDTNLLKKSIVDKLNGVDELNNSNSSSNNMNGDSTISPIITNGANVDSKIDVLANELVDLVVQQLSLVPSLEQIQSIDTVGVDTTTTTTTTERVPIFGVGHTKRLSDQFGIENIFQIPLLSNIATNGDSGTPYVLEYPNTVPSRIYQQLAKSVVQEVAKVQYSNTVGTSQRPNIVYNKDEHTIVVEYKSNSNNNEVVQDIMTPANLRRSCRCAVCVEEMTGRQLLQPATISETIYPKKMYPTGNYALSVDWSDGHRSLYPYKQIKTLLSSSSSSSASNEKSENAVVEPIVQE